MEALRLNGLSEPNRILRNEQGAAHHLCGERTPPDLRPGVRASPGLLWPDGPEVPADTGWGSTESL